jgi:hypothetical protein
MLCQQASDTTATTIDAAAVTTLREGEEVERDTQEDVTAVRTVTDRINKPLLPPPKIRVSGPPFRLLKRKAIDGV